MSYECDACEAIVAEADIEVNGEGYWICPVCGHDEFIQPSSDDYEPLNFNED